MKLLIALTLALAPAVASAQTLQDVFGTVFDLIKILIPIAFALAVLAFFWGIAKFLFKAGDSHAREEGKQFLIWAVVAMFVLVAIGGIIAVLEETFLGNVRTGGPGDYVPTNPFSRPPADPIPESGTNPLPSGSVFPPAPPPPASPELR